MNLDFQQRLPEYSVRRELNMPVVHLPQFRAAGCFAWATRSTANVAEPPPSTLTASCAPKEIVSRAELAELEPGVDGGPPAVAAHTGPATRAPASSAFPWDPSGAQAELLRVPLADGTLVATPDMPPDDLVPSLLAASDVLGTGWFGAVAAEGGRQDGRRGRRRRGRAARRARRQSRSGPSGSSP